jgi:hypothetical protein
VTLATADTELTFYEPLRMYTPFACSWYMMVCTYPTPFASHLPTAHVSHVAHRLPFPSITAATSLATIRSACSLGCNSLYLVVVTTSNFIFSGKKTNTPQVTVPVGTCSHRAASCGTGILVELVNTRIYGACDIQRCSAVQVGSRVVVHVSEQAVGVEQACRRRLVPNSNFEVIN